MDLSKLMRPFGVSVDLVEAVMERPARHAARRASVMRGYYADAAALERLIADQDDPLHYETFEANVPEERGQLVFGVSRLLPGLVGDECFMTKGHFHTVLDTAEIYLCLQGRGYMLLKTPPDAAGHSDCVAEPTWRGRLVYVPPCWAHRSINTGDEAMVSIFIYPGEAGHNYGDIATQGFPKRVFKIHGQEMIR